MSYKEFIPTVQSTGYSHDMPMSPTLGKYLGRSSSEPLPYWSPDSRGGGGSSLDQGRSADRIHRTDGGSYGGYTPIELESDDPTSGSHNGMNLAAASWEPPTLNHLSSHLSDNQRQERQGIGEENEQGYEDELGEQDFIEPVVEIMWNDRTYFVPESTAYAYEEGMGYPHSLEVILPFVVLFLCILRRYLWNNI